MNRASVNQWRNSRRSYDSDSDSDSSDSARSYGRSSERWPCSKCDKDYATKSNLMRHFQAVHTRQQTTVAARRDYRECSYAEDRYPCNLCDKDYATQGNLNRHLQTVHGTNGGTSVRNTASASSTQITQRSSQKTNVNMNNPIINNIYNLRLKD